MTDNIVELVEQQAARLRAIGIEIDTNDPVWMYALTCPMPEWVYDGDGKHLMAKVMTIGIVRMYAITIKKTLRELSNTTTASYEQYTVLLKQILDASLADDEHLEQIIALEPE